MQSIFHWCSLRHMYKRFVLTFIFLVFIYITTYKENENTLSTVDYLSLQTLRQKPYYYPVSCQNLFENDSHEVNHAATLLSNSKPLPFISDHYYNITKEQCHIYRSERFNEKFHQQDTYINQQFPLAFTILLYDNVEQFERLLRVIYRPQNFYCIHVDSHSPSHILKAVQAIVQCFDNIILASKQEKILYTTFSRLQADLNCMKDLLKFPSWKYLLNTAGSEFPLKTNSELVKILSIYRGFNDIEGVWKERNIERTKYVWKIIDSEKEDDPHGTNMQKTNKTKDPPPHNIEIVKGSAYGAFSRAFIEFVLTNSIAKEFLDWSRDTYDPEEHCWASLNYNVHLNTPGGYKAKSDPTIWTARYVNWGTSPCYGRFVRGVCVFGTADLPSLLNRHELFVNKFYLNFDPIAYQCLEELIVNRSQLDLPLNDALFYRQMPFLTSS